MSKSLSSVLFLLLWSLECWADIHDHDRDQALYEIGVAGATFYLPDYPSSQQGGLRALVLPYAYYRGKVLRADDEGGIRSRLVDRERIEMDLSASAGFPADSRDNHARRGMPNIDWIGEIGPRWRAHLIDEGPHRLNFNLPIRYVFSTNFKRFDDRGYLLQPELEYRNDNVLMEDWESTILISAIFASDQLMDYFYEVPEEFATSERPAYQAQGGYLGFGVTLGASREIAPGTTFFCGVKMDDYGQSVNRNSPLFKTPTNWSFAFGLSYLLIESDERAGSRL